MICDTSSDEYVSDIEAQELDKVKLDPVCADNLKNGFPFGNVQPDPSEEEHKKMLKQIYVFLSRCISYPFTCKQSSDRGYRFMNITTQILTKMKDKFNAYLQSTENMDNKDGVFTDSVRWFYNDFLKSNRALEMTQSGGYTTKDFQHVFKKKIYQLVCSLPEHQEMSRMNLLSDWITEYDEIVSESCDEHDRRVTSTEGQLNKTQLYTLFQKILGVSAFEHRILFNACQLGNTDEQNAAVRRELDNRSARVNSGEKPPYTFVHHDMAAQFREQERKAVKELQDKLHTNPNKDMIQLQFDGMDKVGKSLPCKHDFVLNFKIEIEVMEVKGLAGVKSVQPDRKIYCAMDIEAQNSKLLCTDLVSQKDPVWKNKAEFETRMPLPSIRIRLLAMTSNPLLFEGRLLGKIHFKPKPDTLSDRPQWNNLESEVEVGPGGVERAGGSYCLQLKTCVKMDKPENMKLGGFLYIRGTAMWQKWKRRYVVLIQIAPVVFCLCTYKEKQVTPTDMLTLEGYTVNYHTPDPLLHQEADDERFQFRLVKEGEEVVCGAKEAEQQHWVNALYRATGQSTRPQKSDTANGNDVNDIRKAGLDSLISTQPGLVNQDEYYEELQRLTLEYRITIQSTASRGWLSTGQEFALKEYAARYGIRYLTVHLNYLKELIAYAKKGFVIDPNKFRDEFTNCCNYIQGKTSDDGVWTVTREEFMEFREVRDILKALLMNQITHFRNSFPFGRPENALKTTIKLLEQVLTHRLELNVDLDDLFAYTEEEVTPFECRKQTIKCLEQGAYLNYLDISKNILKHMEVQDPDEPQPSIDDLISLADDCIKFLQDTLEYYTEALKSYEGLVGEMNETFWRLYGVDMENVLTSLECGSPVVLPLFHKLNGYLYDEQELRYGKFHIYLHKVFAPHIVSYLDRQEQSLKDDLEEALQREDWLPGDNTEDYSCSAVKEIVAEIKDLQVFVSDLRWPDRSFADHLQTRLQKTTAEIIDHFVCRVIVILQQFPRLQKGNVTTNTVLPDEVCVMINSCITMRLHANDLCGNATSTNNESYSYRTEINELLTRHLNSMFTYTCQQLSQCLVSLLRRISRYDKDSLLSHIFSLVNPKLHIIDPLFSFVRQNNVQIKQEIHKSYCTDLLVAWYDSLLQTMCEWLTERENIDLHHFQLVAISTILKNLFNEFSSQGLTEEQLRNTTYRMIHNRIEYEETMNIEYTRNYNYDYEVKSENSEDS